MDERFWKRLTKILGNQYNQFSQRVDELEQKMINLVDKTYDRMDAVYKEVLDMRTEQASHTDSHRRVDETVEDHEKRLKKINSFNSS